MELNLRLSKDTCELNVSSGSNKSKFIFLKPFVPIFIGAVAKIIFKSFSYSPSINYTIARFIAVADLETIKEPTPDSCFPLFENIGNIPIDFYLLLEIVDRHKKLLRYLKDLENFGEIRN